LSRLIAILDEYGTNSLNIEAKDVSTHFLLNAILIKEENLEEIKKEIDKIGLKYFQGSEIKSNTVKRKHFDRRLRILTAFSKIDFTIFTLVVDKKEIRSKGLTIKQSFYKYFHRQVVQFLNRIDKRITFIADKIGDESFQRSLNQYIHDNFRQIDLFNPEKIYDFSDSKEENLIQLSDFIVGSLARVFDTKLYEPPAEGILKLIEKRLHLRFWPDKIENYIHESIDKTQYDSRIASLSLDLAQDYIRQNASSGDFNIKARINILDYLILFQRIAPRYFIPTYELINRIKFETDVELNERVFRKNIIGSLRDQHVIIVSSNTGGYKLPVNKSDLIEFVNRYNGIIQPMVSRMKKCRESVLIKTTDEIDILDYPEYALLKKMIEEIK
jgi:hypothetical protein